MTDISNTKLHTSHRKVFVRDLLLDAYIGAYDSEQGTPQPVLINIVIDVTEPPVPTADRLEDVLCYNKIVGGVKDIFSSGHIKLVETVAEKIADLVLAHPFSLAVNVRVEKPNAISEAAGAGVEITRVK